MATIHYPDSHLTDRTHPYRLSIDLDPDLRGTAVSLSLQLGPTLTASLELTAPDGALELAVATDALAEGDYSGELTLDAAGARTRWRVRFYRLPEPVAEPFPFAIYAVPLPQDDPAACRARLREVRDSGVNLICQHMNLIGDCAPLLDEAARLGIRFMPSTNLRLRAHEMPADCHDALNVEDAKDADRCCFGAPAVRDRAAADLADRLRDYRAHPAFSGLVYYGDDLFMRFRGDEGRIAISCYCNRCREEFRAQTGLEAPLSTEDTRGPVPADHPWLQWMRFRSGEVYGGFIRRLEATRRAVAPDVRLGLCHGFPFAPFTHLASGLYGPLTQPTPVVSSYAYPYLRSPRVDLIPHWEIGRMGNRDKDVWMLGAINSNWTNWPSWQVYQNYWNMLAAGYRFLGFFAWHDFVTALEHGYAAEVEACKRALGDIGAHKDWIIPTAAHWRPVEAPFATLYSFTTEAFDVSPRHRGHLHIERLLAFYREALRRRVPLDVVCEEEILDGALDRYEAVCLHDVRALREDVRQAVEDYAARGGAVFVDNDILLYYDETHPRIVIPGAIECSPETMVAMLRDLRPPEIAADGEHVALRRLRAGEIDYVVLVNNFTDQYWGYKFHYWIKRVHENYEHMDYVRDEPVETTVRFAAGGRSIADLSSGDIVGATDTALRVSLEPSWGRVYALLPCREAVVDVRGPAVASQGTGVPFDITMCSESGRRLDGAFSVKVTVTAPGGRLTGASGFVGLDAGRARIEIPVAANDAPGDWTLTFEGGFPRRTVTRSLRVTPCEAAAIRLEVGPTDAH